LQLADLAEWMARYERAWRTPGTELLAALFAPDATYRPAPFEQPVAGLDEIARFWESERESAAEVFALAWAPVALDGDVAVARAEVRYAGPPERLYRDLWIVVLNDDGRCRSFEEWPFWPEQPRVAGGEEQG
jgi:ketosteroid isomerase-like protein